MKTKSQIVPSFKDAQQPPTFEELAAYKRKLEYGQSYHLTLESRGGTSSTNAPIFPEKKKQHSTATETTESPPHTRRPTFNSEPRLAKSRDAERISLELRRMSNISKTARWLFTAIRDNPRWQGASQEEREAVEAEALRYLRARRDQ